MVTMVTIVHVVVGAILFIIVEIKQGWSVLFSCVIGAGYVRNRDSCGRIITLHGILYFIVPILHCVLNIIHNVSRPQGN